MPDVFTIEPHDADRYVEALASSARAVQAGDVVQAREKLAGIAGEIWMGKLTLAGSKDVTSPLGPRAPRPTDDVLRARVFVRDRFRCTYCGGRVVPRNVLVAMSDLFPAEIPYNANYKRGETHPAYWTLVPEADHVVAHSRGGANELNNLATLHAACNTQKSDSLLETLPELGLAHDARDWDGLTGAYGAMITAGAGAARPSYHARWSRIYARVTAE